MKKKCIDCKHWYVEGIYYEKVCAIGCHVLLTDHDGNIIEDACDNFEEEEQ